MSGAIRWLALVWRLPTGSSTPRVTIWRSLKRLGAASLTPGAAILPYLESHLEQLGWVAQEIDEMGGDAWILPVAELSLREESRVRQQVNRERSEEYVELAREAATVRADGTRSKRDLTSLRRKLERIRARDHFGAPQRGLAVEALDKATAGIRTSISEPLAIPAVEN